MSGLIGAPVKTVGLNVDGVFDWAQLRHFADAIKSSRGWGSTGTPNDESATLDADGWPMQDAGTVLGTTVSTPRP